MITRDIETPDGRMFFEDGAIWLEPKGKRARQVTWGLELCRPVKYEDGRVYWQDWAGGLFSTNTAGLDVQTHSRQVHSGMCL